jgi:hypothetical protein
LLQQPTTNDFDEWLTSFPDKGIERLLSALEPPIDGYVKDRQAFTFVLSLILRFGGKPALHAAEIANLLLPFATCLALEMLCRQGRVIKQGKHSLIPDDGGALFTIVKQNDSTPGE